MVFFALLVRHGTLQFSNWGIEVQHCMKSIWRIGSSLYKHHFLVMMVFTQDIRLSWKECFSCILVHASYIIIYPKKAAWRKSENVNQQVH